MSRVLSRAKVIERLGEPTAYLLVSRCLHASVHLIEEPGRRAPESVRFDTFLRLLDDGLIVERPRYRDQPLDIARYALQRPESLA